MSNYAPWPAFDVQSSQKISEWIRDQGDDLLADLREHARALADLHRYEVEHQGRPEVLRAALDGLHRLAEARQEASTSSVLHAGSDAWKKYVCTLSPAQLADNVNLRDLWRAGFRYSDGRLDEWPSWYSPHDLPGGRRMKFLIRSTNTYRKA